MKVFQKELNHGADRDVSLGYLKKTYALIMQGVDIPDSPAELETEEATSSASAPNKRCAAPCKVQSSATSFRGTPH